MVYSIHNLDDKSIREEGFRMKKIMSVCAMAMTVMAASMINDSVAFASVDNQTIEKASSIPSSTETTGIFERASSVYYYKATMPANGLFTVQLQNDGHVQKVELLNEIGTHTLATLQSNPSTLIHPKREIGLKKGQQVYIKVTTNKTGAQKPYVLKTTFKASNQYEKEMNDTIRLANTIAPTSKTIGTLQGKNDEDYFRFTLKKNGQIQVKMDQAGEAKTVTIFNSQNKVFAKFTTNNRQLNDAVAKVGLPKGTYYTKVTTAKKAVVPYTMQLNFTASNYFEKESNDTIRTANSVALNKTYKATLQGKQDRDYYKFTVKKKKTVYVYVSNGNSDKNVQLLSTTGKRMETFKTDSDLRGASYIRTTLSKGTYYVNVYNNSSYFEDYTIKVK